MMGRWTGTFTVTRRLVDGALVTSVCAQDWTIASQAGNAFSGTFELRATPERHCEQTGTITGTVFADGTVASLFARNTTPTLACVTLGYTWTLGSLSGGTLRAEWIEELSCQSGPVMRTVIVEMWKIGD